MKNTNKALLVMDMQALILDMFPNPQPVITNVKQCIAHARANNIPVIYAVLGFRNGQPEIAANNAYFYSFKEKMAALDMSKISEIHPELAPLPNEVVVTKKRISAFTGSDLDLVLRSLNINSLVLTGIATSGIVLSTFTEAFDKDYKLTVITDACADRDTEVHQMLTKKYFAGKGAVYTTNEWVMQ